MNFKYGIDQLSVTHLQGLLDDTETGILTDTVKEQIIRSRKRVDHLAAQEKAVYGINTGFGPLCDTKISASQTSQLQTNLLISHAVGVGDPIDPRLSKLMMICKVHALSQGYSGIHLELVERILYFIEHNLCPLVPSQGSVGASGDLAPLSHLFLPLIGEGEFLIDGKIVPAAQVLQQHGLKKLSLQAKEGLALINGTQFILALSLIHI